MKIGIDIDDTICDTWLFLVPYLSSYFNIDLDELKRTQKCYYDACNSTFEEYCEFAKKNYATFALQYKLKDNVVEVLNKLRLDGNEIIFISARSNNGFNNPYKTSYDYLKLKHVPFDKLIVCAKDKAKICLDEGINIFIDDGVDNCIKVKNENIPVLLFDASFNQNCKEIKRVFDWNEVYEEIEKVKKIVR